MGDAREHHAALREQELTNRLFGGSAAHPVQEDKADNAAPAPLASLGQFWTPFRWPLRKLHQ